MTYIEFIEGKKHAKQYADESDSIETFADAGYLLTDNDLIVDIDCLEKETIQKMISLFNIQTETVWTDRGVHLYFKKPDGFRGAKKVCSLGFEIEYKHLNNTKAITVRRNGKTREIEREGVRESLPDVFTQKGKRHDSLLGFDEGDGRNDELFKHRMRLNSCHGWANMLRFINNHIFAEALTEEEFQTIIRDVKIKAEKDNEPEIADYIMNKYKVVSYTRGLYFNKDGAYIHDMDVLNRMVYDVVGYQKTRYVNEIIEQMKFRAPIIDEDSTFDIKFKNGILRDGKFIKVDYQEFTPFNVELAYNPDAKSVKCVDDYIDHLTNNDPKYRELLLEILAHPFIVDKEFKRLMGKFFIFVGDGGNGKGTLLAIIRRILNQKNCTGLSVKNMSDERYFITLRGKLVNLGDDLQDEAINNEQMKHLKNISTCDFVSTRKLFEQSKDIEMTTSLIFTSNHILKSFEKGESYKRRVLWLPMYGKPKSKDRRFISNLTSDEALEYWLKLIVDGYQRLYKNERFTESEVVHTFNDEYHEENNSSLLYLGDLTKDDLIGKRSPEVHEEYKMWADENGMTVHSNKLLKNSIYDVFGLSVKAKKINRKTAKVYQ